MRVFCTLNESVLSCYTTNPFEQRDPKAAMPLQEINMGHVNVRKLINRGAKAVSFQDGSNVSRNNPTLELVFPSAGCMDKWLGCVQVPLPPPLSI